MQCPNKTEIANFKKAVHKGFITWHAGPMNMQIEVMTPWLLKYGLDMSRGLDESFNITRKARVLSQRDVPGDYVIIIADKNGILYYRNCVYSYLPLNIFIACSL